MNVGASCAPLPCGLVETGCHFTLASERRRKLRAATLCDERRRKLRAAGLCDERRRKLRAATLRPLADSLTRLLACSLAQVLCIFVCVMKAGTRNV